MHLFYYKVKWNERISTRDKIASVTENLQSVCNRILHEAREPDCLVESNQNRDQNGNFSIEWNVLERA